MAKNGSKKKMNIFLKILLIILGVVFGLLILLIILLYAFFFDSSKINYVGDNNPNQTSDIKDIAQNKIVDGFNKTKETGMITVSVSQDDLNSVFYNVKSKIEKEIPNPLKMTSLGIDINDNEYVFSVSLDATSIFKTRLYIHCSLNEITENNVDLYEFKINKVQLARAGFLSNPAMNLVKKFVSNDTINQAFKDNKLSLKADLDNNRITYSKNDLLKDITSMVSSGGESSLSEAFISTAFEYNLFKTDFYKDHAINFSVDLNKMAKNAIYTEDTRGIHIDNTKLANNLVSLMDNNKFPVTSDNVNLVMHYFLNGYASSSSQAKAFVEDKDFSSIGISDVKAYKGANESLDINFNEEIKKQINQINIDQLLGKEARIASFPEDQLSEVLLHSGLFGYSSIFYQKGSDNKYHLAYMTIDNCYCQIQDNKFSIIFQMNMNGFKTSIIIDTTPSEMQNYKINLNINKILLGEIEIGGELKSFIYDIIENGLKNNSESWISFDKQNATLVINLKPALEISTLNQYINSSNRFSSKMIGKTLQENGQLEFYFDAKNLSA